jgi:predicted nucleic acid-binding protein
MLPSSYVYSWNPNGTTFELFGRDGIKIGALVHYEILNALYQYERHGKLSKEIVSEAFEVALGLPIRLYSDTALHLRAIQLARQFALPACYDAHYLALAERLDAELWTCDARLVTKVGAALPWVHLVP